MSCTPLSGIKNDAYVITAVDRATHCILGWAVCSSRTAAVMQAVVDMGPPAQHDHRDALIVYQSLVYALVSIPHTGPHPKRTRSKTIMRRYAIISPGLGGVPAVSRAA